MPDRYEQVGVSSRAEWRAWLAGNHDRSAGVWLVFFKKGRGPHVPYDDLVEEAIAFGWVDSQSRRLDEDRSQLLMTPRRATSRWSRSNRARVERLEAAGLMAPSGRAAVEAAKARGTWPEGDEPGVTGAPEPLRKSR